MNCQNFPTCTVSASVILSDADNYGPSTHRLCSRRSARRPFAAVKGRQTAKSESAPAAEETNEVERALLLPPTAEHPLRPSPAAASSLDVRPARRRTPPPMSSFCSSCITMGGDPDALPFILDIDHLGASEAALASEANSAFNLSRKPLD